MLRLHNPTVEPSNTRKWLVNGYPAIITIWSDDEFKKLDKKPPDAQYYPNGLWVMFRME